MISIWKMIYDLEYWLHIGTGNDIVRSPDNRKEYQHLVEHYRKLKVEDEKIPAKVIVHLKKEAEIVWFKRRTFWRNLWLWVKR
jgi:hypothetical protein